MDNSSNKKEKYAWGRYGLVISALLVFVVSVFLSFNNIFEQKRLIEKESRINMWFLAQLEIEYLRLLENLNLYQIAESGVSKEDVMLRFEVFWSRLPVLMEGAQTEAHRSIPNFEQTMEQTLSALKQAEPLITELKKDDLASLFQIRALLTPLGKPIHYLVLDGLTFESAATNADRKQSEGLYFQLLALFSGTYTVVAVLFFALYRETQKSSRAEKAASTARAQLIEAIESIPDAFVLFDDEDRLVLCNTNFRKFHPNSSDILVPGTKFEELTRAGSESGELSVTEGHVYDSVRRRPQSLHQSNNPVEIQVNDGRWLRIAERHTKHGWIVGIHTDITELKLRERELADKSALLAVTMESINQGICAFDIDLQLMTWNSTYRRMFELPEDAISTGAPLTTLLSLVADRSGMEVADQQRLMDEHLQFAKEVATDKQRRRTTELKRPSGATIETTFNAMPGGGVVTTYADISERVRAEEERTALLAQVHASQEENLRLMMEHEAASRRSAELRLNDAIECSSEAVILLDAEGRIVTTNSQAKIILPSVAEYLAPGKFYSAFLEEAKERGLFSGRPASLWGGPPGEGVSPISVPAVVEEHLADGRWFRASQGITHEGGTVIIWSDITELREREERLRVAKEEAEAANESKTVFLANMSHELRTPLNAVIGFADIIAQELFGEVGQKQYKTYAADILRSGHHLLDIINDILDYAKSERGKLQLHLDEVEPYAIVEMCRKIMQGQCEQADVKLCVEQEGCLPNIHSDAAKLRQVLLNLLSNALKFTPPGGQITLLIQKATSSGILIKITDTGIGMRPEDIPAALQPFSQLDTSLARKYEGTGLGLPLTKRLVELLGGQLSIESALGDGTTVSVNLPPGPPDDAGDKDTTAIVADEGADAQLGAAKA